MYYDDFSKNQSFISLKENKRPDRFTPSILIESVSSNDKSGFIFNEGDKLKFTLSCKALENVEDVFVRMTINYNYIPVGTTISNNLGNIQKGQQKIYNLVFDAKGLQQGTYSTKIFLFSGTIQGIPKVLDIVEDAFSFNIINGKMISFGWNNKNWGSINFPNMQLE